MAEAALTPRTHLLIYYSLRNIPVFLSTLVITEVSKVCRGLLFHQRVGKPGGSWTDQKVSFKCGWLISGDMKSLDHKQCLMFDLQLSVKWKCQDPWKNILFESWVGWNTSHSVVISDPIPSSDTFEEAKEKRYLVNIWCEEQFPNPNRNPRWWMPGQCPLPYIFKGREI